MGLSRLLARAAAQRLHVLLVEGDDAFVLRAAAERSCLARGWVLALSPADADVMLACRPRPAVVSDAVDAVFAQLPGPRARADLWHERHLEAVLDQLHASYLVWPSAPNPGRSADTSPEAGDRHGAGTAQHPTAPPGHESHGHTPGHHDLPAPSEHSHPSEQHAQAAAGQRHFATPEPHVGPVHSPHAQSPEHVEHGMQDAEKQEHDNSGQDMHPAHGEKSPHDTHSGHGDDSGQDTHSSRDDDSGQNEGSGQEAHSGDDEAQNDDPENADDLHDAHSGHDMHSMHSMHDMDDMDDMDDMQSGHDMNMAGPGGVALASGAPDRDGLEMDRLHVQLGPVLASWPAGLVVWCTLAGDVVTQVDVVEPAFALPQWAGRDLLVAVRLDAAAQLLGLAGADAAARRVRAARDTVLVRGRRTTTASRLVDGLPRSVERTPLLRWSLRGLGIVSASAAVEHGWPQDWVGDVHSRLLHLLDPLAPLEAGLVEGGVVAGALPVLLNGLDVAAARLVVASLVAHAANAAADRVAAPLRATR